MRPHIVWFGEFPFEMDRIMAALGTADLFLCIGTSGVVYPAAGFAREAARRTNCRLIEVNVDQTAISSHFHQHIQGPAAVELPKLVDSILHGR